MVDELTPEKTQVMREINSIPSKKVKVFLLIPCTCSDPSDDGRDAAAMN